MNISVVIPAYNNADCLPRAIQSCMQQSHIPYEIIVVNDKSSDDTVEVIRNHFPHVKLVNLPVNGGPSTARNKGWEVASGDVVAFLDADDSWHPEKLKIISDTFQAHAEIMFVGHPYTLNGFTDKIPEPIISKVHYSAIIASNPFQSSCISVRKILAERFDERMRYCEDHEFAIRVAYKKGCYQLSIALTKLGRPQLTKGGASANVWKMRKGELRAYSSLAKLHPVWLPAIPVLWLYSLAKHTVRLLK